MHFFLFVDNELNIYVITCTMNFLLLEKRSNEPDLFRKSLIFFCEPAKNALMSLIYSEEFGLHFCGKTALRARFVQKYLICFHM